MLYFKKYFITENLDSLYLKRLQNSRAKGIDKHNSHTFQKNKLQQLEIIESKCHTGQYSFTPFLELLKLKGRNKIPRAISIPTFRDRLVLLALKEYLHEFFSDQVNRKRPNAYVKDIKTYINTNKKEKHFVKLDIKTFYDSIDHDILLGMLKDANLDPLAISLVEGAIKNPTVPNNTRKEQYSEYASTKGVPQGTSISNILAQVYLQNLDKTIDKRTYFYSRYVDDILLINDEPFSKFRLNNLKKVITDLNLKLHEGKEEQGVLSDSFDFLGYTIRDNSISIANKNVELFIRRIAGKFTWFKNGIERPSTRPKWLLTNDDRYREVFLEELNESITGIISDDKNYGWLFYFSEMNDQSLLFKIDKIINQFFEQLEPFDYKTPTDLKKLVRTYFTIKHKNNINYITNYSDYDTIRKKRSFLEFRGYIDPENDYKDWEINTLFKKYRNKQLRYVESDIGYNYI